MLPWFQLFDEDRLPYLGRISADQVSVSPANIAAFRKEVKKEFPNQLASFDASQLQVYRNKDDIGNVSPLKGSIPVDSSFDNDEEHPLAVVVPAPQGVLAAITLTRSRVQYVKSLRILRVPDACFSGSGLTRISKEDHFLYCRSRFHEQFNFLREALVEKKLVELVDQNPYTLGWILGPPGTGKSTATLAFAHHLDKDWIVTWIHLDRNLPPSVFQLIGDRKLVYPELSDVKSLLNLTPRNQKHAVFLDGYSLTDAARQILSICNYWVKSDWEHRRLNVICSMSSRVKADANRDPVDRLVVFKVYSWTEDEFKAMVREDEIFRAIRPKLLGNQEKVEEEVDNLTKQVKKLQILDRDALVEAKFFFSGGSCRFFADLDEAAVVQQIDDALQAVDNIKPYVTGAIGDLSSHVVNRLFSLLPNTKTQPITSHYAAIQMALKFGPAAVVQLATTLSEDSNPAMDGWFLEMWFFASIRAGDLVCRDLEDDSKSVTFKKQRVDWFDPLKAFGIKGESCCLKPMKWNQGGYDAVFVTKSPPLVQFVQVASGKDHTLLLDFFSEAFQNLELEGKKDMDIFYLTNNPDFMIGDTQGKFKAFAPTRQQAQSKARILLVDVKFNL